MGIKDWFRRRIEIPVEEQELEIHENMNRVNVSYPWVPNDYVIEQLTELRRLWLRSLINPWRDLEDWKFLDKVFFVAATARFINMRINYVCNTNISFNWDKVDSDLDKENKIAVERVIKRMLYNRSFDFLQYLKFVERAVFTGIEGVYVRFEWNRGLVCPAEATHIDGRRFRYYQEPIGNTGEHMYVLGILNPMRVTADRVHPRIYESGGVYLDEKGNIVRGVNDYYSGAQVGKLVLDALEEHELENMQVLIYNPLESSNKYGVGILVPGYYAIRLQQIITELLGVAGERFSFPFIGITLDPENFKASGRSAKKSYTEAVQEVLDLFEKMKGAGVFAVPYALDINMIDVGAGKIESLIKLLQYLDSIIGDSILGSAGAILDNRGTYGAKSAQKTLMHTYIEDDYAFLERAVNCKLMVQCYNKNIRVFEKLGIEDSNDLPWIEIASVRSDDPMEIRQNIAAVLPAGYRPTKPSLEKLGLNLEDISQEGGLGMPGENESEEEEGTGMSIDNKGNENEGFSESYEWRGRVYPLAGGSVVRNNRKRKGR
jgi:hypothetical protein